METWWGHGSRLDRNKHNVTGSLMIMIRMKRRWCTTHSEMNEHSWLNFWIFPKYCYFGWPVAIFIVAISVLLLYCQCFRVQGRCYRYTTYKLLSTTKWVHILRTVWHAWRMTWNVVVWFEYTHWPTIGLILKLLFLCKHWTISCFIEDNVVFKFILFWFVQYQTALKPQFWVLSTYIYQWWSSVLPEN